LTISYACTFFSSNLFRAKNRNERQISPRILRLCSGYTDLSGWGIDPGKKRWEDSYEHGIVKLEIKKKVKPSIIWKGGSSIVFSYS
jgi:hypothetical protein